MIIVPQTPVAAVCLLHCRPQLPAKAPVFHGARIIVLMSSYRPVYRGVRARRVPVPSSLGGRAS